MQISIHDSSMERIGFMNNDMPDALHYFDDTWHRYLKEGTSTFDFTVSKSHTDSALITTQSYISFNYESQDYLFNVMVITEDDYLLHVQCENLNLELINEQLNPKTNKEKHTLDWYIWNAAGLSSNVIAIGNNPFTDTKILTFENTETKLERLMAIISSWNGEFEFVTSLKNDGTLNQLLLNIYPEGGVGEVRDDVTLYYGRNIEGVTRTEDKSDMFNATKVTDSNNKYKWSNLEKSVKNSEGNIEFYKKLNEDMAYAPIGKDLFPSQIKNDKADQWIRKDFQIEAKSAEDLWDYALSQLKQYAYPLLTYEVVASSNAVREELGNNKRLNIGDTVIVQDTNFDKTEGGLILSTRISEQEISFTNPLNDKLTFSNFVKLKSQISDDLIDHMNDLINQNTPYRSEVETTNGIQFKNGTGSTKLIARIYFGSDSTETLADSYSWTKDGDIVADAQEITVDAKGINEKAVYAYKAMVNDKVVGTGSVTITNVNDGEADTNGTDGADGRSVTSIEQKYQVTQTGEIPPETWEDPVWQAALPQLSATNKHLWSITRTTFNIKPLTQDIVEQKAVYGDSGSNGDPGKIVSDTEPTTKFKGLTWKYIGVTVINASDGTNIQPNTEYYWNGEKWFLNLINAQNINVNTLSAITADLGDTTAGSLTLANEGKGGISIKDGEVISWDLSKIIDPAYPDGYSYTSMGTALDSGGISFYSAGYGKVLNDGEVIDDTHKVATLRAVAHNNHENISVGLVLDIIDENYPLSVTGKVTLNSLEVSNNPVYGVTKNNGWYEEKLGDNFYRWTQIFTVGANIAAASGSLYNSDTLTIPAAPTGSTDLHRAITILAAPWPCWSSYFATAGGFRLLSTVVRSYGEVTLEAVLYGSKN